MELHCLQFTKPIISHFSLHPPQLGPNLFSCLNKSFGLSAVFPVRCNAYHFAFWGFGHIKCYVS